MQWKIHSLFAGIECFREALLILESAIADRFSIKLHVDHVIMVPEHVLDMNFLSVCFVTFHPSALTIGMLLSSVARH